MTFIKTSPFILLLFFLGYITNIYSKTQDSISIKEDSIFLYDYQRDRIVPVAFYDDHTPSDRKEIVILNHGYGGNKGGDYKLYSHIAAKLAESGYFIISIQHELPDDELLAMEGDLYKNRLPNWKRGVENILFVINEFKKLKPEMDWNRLSLLGHSNGGDMAMLFAKEYPDKIKKAISLDNRRMHLPRVQFPRIYSLRGSDYPADEGVIPTQAEQDGLGIQIIYLDIPHSNMDDKATPAESKVINDYLLQFLRE